MHHPSPAPELDQDPWSATCVHLMGMLIRAAWENGYTAVPRDGGLYPVVLLRPRTGIQSPRWGRLHLAFHSLEAAPWWYWSDTDEALVSRPTDTLGLIVEIDCVLKAGR